MSVHAFARALGGAVAGRNRVTCPGPGHSSRDRSLSILFSPQAPDGFIVRSHAGDDDLLCKDFVRSRLGLTKSGLLNVAPTLDAKFDRERTARAMDLWNTGTSPEGTPIERYLSGRGVRLSSHRASDAVRWHSKCPFGSERVGCMVALVRDVVTDAPKGIHRTALNQSGQKLSQLGSNGRLALGPVGGGAVKFTPDEDVTRALAIGEGIETCLSVRNLPNLECLALWALLSAGQVARFPILGGVDSLWLCVDHDETGIAAADAVRCRWQQADRTVFTIKPTMAGFDLNDLAKGPSHA